MQTRLESTVDRQLLTRDSKLVLYMLYMLYIVIYTEHIIILFINPFRIFA